MYKSFKEMPIWEKAIDIAEQIHLMTENLPKKEDYGFTSQVRRSALSISAKIAEAFGRNHTMDKVNFYYMARGSLTETQSHLEYSRRVGYLKVEQAGELDKGLCEIYNETNKIILSLKAHKK